MAGYVYVTVGGNAVNDGIMLMNGSGGGDTGGSYRLQWTNEGGFTGTGWEGAWHSSNVPLQRAWSDAPATGFGFGSGTKYPTAWASFLAYVSQPSVTDLSTWLDNAGWNNAQKYTFAHEDPYVWMYCTTAS